MTRNTPEPGIVEKEDYLLVTFPPYRSVKEMKSQISIMYNAIAQHASLKLLIDSRATRTQIPILDLYDLCVYLVGKLGPLQYKVAVIASPEAVYADRFGENVLRNRGLNAIRFVDNEQAALDWLLERKPVSQH